jgi:hypothetical protein
MVHESIFISMNHVYMYDDKGEKRKWLTPRQITIILMEVFIGGGILLKNKIHTHTHETSTKLKHV